MSVITTYPITIFPYIPPPELGSRYPIGEWRGSAVLVGNATGGIVEADFAPPTAAQARKYLWCWEGFGYRTSAVLGGATSLVLQLITGEANIQSYIRTFSVDDVGISRGVISAMESSFEWARILGYKHQPDVGLTNSYSIAIGLNVNAISYYLSAWGYIWLPQSRRAGALLP